MTGIQRRKTEFWGYDQHDRSVLDVVDEDEWQTQLDWALTESLAYARLLETPETPVQANQCAQRNFLGHFEAMLNDLLHEPLNICTATEKVQETEQATLIPDGGTTTGFGDVSRVVVAVTDPLECVRLRESGIAELVDTSPEHVRDALESVDWAYSMTGEGEWAFDRHLVFADDIPAALESYPDRYEEADFNV